MDTAHQEANGLEDSSSESVVELVPFDSYNVTKSKTRASLLWLIHQAYRFGQLPGDLVDPFFKDKDGHDHLKPLVIKLLGSSELYCKASQQVFNCKDQPWSTHMSVMQALSRRGVYVLDENDQAVTQAVLAQTTKIKLPAHLAMMDALMMAYACELVTVEKIVHAVRKFTSFNASSELPYDIEDGLLFWLNKVACTTQQIMEKRLREQQQHYIDNPMQKIRLRRPNLPPKEMQNIPLMENLLTDIGDGCSLALLIHFYCPQGVDFEDISLNKTMSLAESMHNLQLVKAFLDHYVPGSFHFCYEDLLYSHPKLKTNILAILAELFYLTEVETPDWVRPLYLQQQEDYPGRYTPQVPISNITKMSFQVGQMRHATSNPEINKTLSREPLLPKRHHQQYGSHDDILDHHKVDDITIKQSMLAWQDKNQLLTPLNRVQIASHNSGSLLANVSIDSDLDDGEQTQDNQLTYRMTSSQGAPQVTANIQDPLDEADLEIQSLTSPKSSSQGSLYQKDSGVDVMNKSGQSLASKSTGGPEYFRQDENTYVTMMNEESRKATVTRNSTFRVDRQPPVHPLVPSSANVIRKETFRVHDRDKGNVRQRFVYPQTSSKESRTSSHGQDNSMCGGQDQRSNLSLVVQPVDMKLPRQAVYTDGIMPANVRPLKEKVNYVNKDHEYGETSSSHSPRSTSSNDSSRVMTSWGQSRGTSGTPDSFGAVTPLSGMSTGSLTSAPSHASEQRRVFESPRQQWNAGEPNMAKARGGEAFYINTDEQIGTGQVVDSGYKRHGVGDSLTVSSRVYNVQPVEMSTLQHEYMPSQTRRSHEWMGMPSTLTVVHARQSSDPQQLQAFDRYQTSSHGMEPLITHSPNSSIHTELSKPNQSFHYHGGKLQNQGYGQSTGMDIYSAGDHVSYSHSDKESFKLQSEMLTKETLAANEVTTSFAPLVSQSADQIDRHESINYDVFSHPDVDERLDPMHVDVVSSDVNVVNGESHGMTTWIKKVKHESDSVPSIDAGNKTDNSWEPSASEMLQLRLKLEEKRRNIDREKRKMERNFNKQRQRVGKAAFMQIIRNENNELGDACHEHQHQLQGDFTSHVEPSKITFADLGSAKQNQNKVKDELLRNVSSFPHTVPTGGSAPTVGVIPSIGSVSGVHSGTHSPHLTTDEYNNSIEKMNANLSQLQNEITRLSQQHERIIHNIGSEPQSANQESNQISETKTSSPSGGFFLQNSGPVEKTIETDKNSNGFYLQGPPQSSEPQGFYLGKEDRSSPQLEKNQCHETSEDKNDGCSFILHSQPPTLNVANVEDNSHTSKDDAFTQNINYQVPDTSRKISDNKIPYDSIYGLSDQVQGNVPQFKDSDFHHYNANVERVSKHASSEVVADVVPQPVIENRAIEDNEPKVTQTEDPAEHRIEGLVEKKRFAKFEIGNEDGEFKDKVRARPKRFSVNLDSSDNEITIVEQVHKEKKSAKSSKTPPVEVRKAPVKPVELTQEPVNAVHEVPTKDQSEKSTSVLDDAEDQEANVSHNRSTGFVIDEEKVAVDDIAKKRDQFLKSRLKRQELEKVKQAKREALREKQREEQRRKQEDIEMKKAEEKARRERIRLEYQIRKQQEEDEANGKAAKPKQQMVCNITHKGFFVYLPFCFKFSVGFIILFVNTF
ncbi:calmodulin-regulated spectrin-associated protein 1-B-like [Anneissia japonica]|uniref:calmodulin-regulated spectrin-associated protein 1-B-like n=1 Tax=Anneissia japonica TaxID=1529436 RepID=UPI0014258D85|nr:calmodulin-regulated spectrin-associated protein 1-B-like [Anneissia japonica]